MRNSTLEIPVFSQVRLEVQIKVGIWSDWTGQGISLLLHSRTRKRSYQFSPKLGPTGVVRSKSRYMGTFTGYNSNKRHPQQYDTHVF